ILAEQLGKGVETFARRKNEGPASMSLLDSVALHDKGLMLPSWDEAAQRYLAIVALYRAQVDLDPRRRDPRRMDQIRALGLQLKFPDDLAANARYDSPRDFDPAKFEDALQTIRQGLRK